MCTICFIAIFERICATPNVIDVRPGVIDVSPAFIFQYKLKNQKESPNKFNSSRLPTRNTAQVKKSKCAKNANMDKLFWFSHCL